MREFISDKTLPKEFRTPIVAARRRRQVKRKNVAAVDPQFLGVADDWSGALIAPSEFKNAIEAGVIKYIDLDNETTLVPIYSYVVIRNQNRVLIHNKGSYAESRRKYVSKDMLGFPVPICHDDLTLFDAENHGVVQAGLTAVANDLDLEFSPEFPTFEISADFLGIIPLTANNSDRALIAVVSVEAPSDFEPTGKRLAVGNLHWRDLLESVPKAEFDPWSRQILSCLPQILDRRLL